MCHKRCKKLDFYQQIAFLINKSVCLLSADPVPCFSPPGFSCSCHYFLYEKADVYSCPNTSASVESLPPTVPHGTDWFLLIDSQVKILAGDIYYLNSIVYLNLNTNHIESITDDFINTVNKNQSLRWLNLANNYLATIPSNIQKLTFLQKIWLGGNVFDCHCSMTWMVGWLNNFTTSKGEHIIIDYKDVYCHSGLNIGDPIYKLDEVSMGCFPNKWSLFQKVGVGIGSAVAVVIITVLMIISVRNSRSLRFFIFHKLNVRSALYWNANKEDDNLETMKYDAYLTYR